MITGDLIFFRTKLSLNPASWLSTLIRFFAKIKYNHVGVIILIWGEPFVIEALGKGIVATPLSKRIIGKKIRICRPFRNINEKLFAQKTVSYLSTKYDFIGLLFYQLVLNLTGHWIGGGSKNQERRLYCYEFVALMHKADCTNWYSMLPKDLLNAKWHEIIFEN